MYEGSLECTECSNPASVCSGGVCVTATASQGVPSCVVGGWGILCPSQSASAPRPLFFKVGGGLSHQPTNGIYVVMSD